MRQLALPRPEAAREQRLEPDATVQAPVPPASELKVTDPPLRVVLDDAESSAAPADAGRRTAPGSGRRITRTELLWAVGVAAAAVALATVFRSSIVPTDPWHYVQGALAFPEGSWRPAGLSRWGFLLPIVPFARLWGDAPATYYAVPLLTAALLAAVLSLLGTRFAGRIAGVVGVVLTLTSPLVLVNLTRGYPDLTATMLVGVAILLATLAEDAAKHGFEGWRASLLLTGCGLATGWSVEVRETAVFAWPVIGWILLRIGRPRRTLLWFGLPVLAWLVLDLGLSTWVYQDPLVKLRILLGADISASEVTSDASYVGHSRWWYATVLPRAIAETTAGPAVLLALTVGLVGGVVFRRELGRIWAWGALSLGLLWASGGPLDPGHPSVRLDVARYWVSFLVPLLLTAAASLVLAVRRTSGSRRAGAVAGAGLLAVASLVPTLHFAASYPGFARNGGTALAELRAELAATPGMPEARIWADWGTNRLLPIYQRGTFGPPEWTAADFRSLNRLRDRPHAIQPAPGDFVALYSTEDRACWQCRRAFRDLEDWWGPLPRTDWLPVFTSTDGRLSLYRIPAATSDPHPDRVTDTPPSPDRVTRPTTIPSQT